MVCSFSASFPLSSHQPGSRKPPLQRVAGTALGLSRTASLFFFTTRLQTEFAPLPGLLRSAAPLTPPAFAGAHRDSKSVRARLVPQALLLQQPKVLVQFFLLKTPHSHQDPALPRSFFLLHYRVVARLQWWTALRLGSRFTRSSITSAKGNSFRVFPLNSSTAVKSGSLQLHGAALTAAG